MARQGFPKSYRLLKRPEFLLVYSEGTPYRNAGFHLFRLARAESGLLRLGLTVSRSAGPSVARNRLRRWARESFRLRRDKMVTGYDVVMNFHRSLAAKTRPEFDRLLEDIWRKAGLLHEGPRQEG